MHEKTQPLTPELEGQVDAELLRFEAPVIRGQFQAAVRHVEAALEETLARDAQAARALIAKLYLATGDRRFKTIEPCIDRRAS